MGVVPTIFEQTGWRGALPETICQEWDALLAVSQYDYDLTSIEFVEYCECRGSINRVMSPGSVAGRFCRDHWRTKAEYFSEGHEADDDRGIRHSYSEYQLGLQWTMILAARGAMQDSWEIYCFRR